MSRPLICDGCGIPIADNVPRLRMASFAPPSTSTDTWSPFVVAPQQPVDGWDFCSFPCVVSMASSHAEVGR